MDIYEANAVGSTLLHSTRTKRANLISPSHPASRAGPGAGTERHAIGKGTGTLKMYKVRVRRGQLQVPCLVPRWYLALKKILVVAASSAGAAADGMDG
jgi:hypothetical protein